MLVKVIAVDDQDRVKLSRKAALAERGQPDEFASRTRPPGAERPGPGSGPPRRPPGPPGDGGRDRGYDRDRDRDRDGAALAARRVPDGPRGRPVARPERSGVG